jgi:outer membrane receptor protein involved in Fe transport
MIRKHWLQLARVSSLALAIAGAAGTAQAQEVVGEARDEILVTATKREEAISRAPLAISAVTGEALAEANANSLADYIVRLPGVVFNDYQPGVSEVVIRGIAATTYHEQGQTTVGYYLNEIPLVEPGFPIGIPDIDTFDLERVEVLRGPQGTLFGSSSLGGLVNYVVKTADTSKFDAAASGLVGVTKNSDGELNYAAKAMINLPIIADTLAVRVMALQRVDAGYLDNPGIGVDGSNDFRTRGLRGSVVFTPGPDTTLTWLSTYQDTQFDDQSYLDTDNPYVRITQRAETQQTDFWLNSLRLDQGLGFAKLTVLGAITKKNNETVFSYPYPYVTGDTTGDEAAWSFGKADATIKTIEARLTSPGNGLVNWLIGTSYMRADKSSYDQIFQQGAEAFINANPAGFGGVSGSVLAPGDRIYGYISDGLNEDLGIFGELSIKPIPALELILGGRYYWNRYRATVANQPGAVSGSATGSTATVEEKEDGFTPKVTLALRPSDTFMAYMTYSQGYRVGGINPNAGFLPTIPQSYGSDTTDNYEAGVKFSLFDRKLYLEATAFSIDWSGIQARLFGPAPNFFSYVSNAGGANVGGVELAATVQLARFASFSTNVTYQDAKLTDFLPDTFAPGGGYVSGTRLPGSSNWSVANNLRFELADSPLSPSFEIAHRYLSEAPVAFGNPNTRGNFNIVDLRVSITAFDNVKLLAFANNVLDEYGILNAPFTDAVAPAGSIVRPRTIGLRLDWSL